FNLFEFRRSAVTAEPILAPGDFLHLAPAHQVSQAYATEEGMDLIAQVAPQVVRQAGTAIMAIPHPLATGGIYRFVDRIDHLRNLNGAHFTSQVVAAAGATHAGYQFVAAQLG